jgi:hypothetical protein
MARQLPHLQLAHPHLRQGGTHAPLSSCLHSRPVVGQIVGVEAIHHVVVSLGLRQPAQQVMQVAFAEVAAVSGVGGVAGILQLLGLDDLVADADGLGLPDGLLQIFGQKGRGGGSDGQGPLPQLIPGQLGHQAAIHPA